MPQEIVVLWTEADWRCEFHARGGVEGRIDVYRAGQLVTSENTLSAQIAEQRAEVLRQRVLRGDLRADPRSDDGVL
jgi:hypothetical protein